MYEAVKNVIASGNFELVKMLEKIDVLWIQGSLTDDQRLELVELARGKADVRNGIDVYAKLAELDRAVKDNAAAIAALKSGGTESGDSTAETEEYPAYVAGKWYYAGDKCSENGKNYECCAPEGQVCTWSPSGYPDYWTEV